jgi:hypothetical protein
MIDEPPAYPDYIGVSEVSTRSREPMMVETFMDSQPSCMADEPLGFDIGDPPVLAKRVEALAIESDRRCPQLGLFHRAQIPMHVRWLRARDGSSVFEQRHHLGDGPTPAQTLAEHQAPAA